MKTILIGLGLLVVLALVAAFGWWTAPQYQAVALGSGPLWVMVNVRTGAMGVYIAGPPTQVRRLEERFEIQQLAVSEPLR